MVRAAFYYESTAKNAMSGTDSALDLWRESLKPFGIQGLDIIDPEGLNPPVGDAELETYIWPNLEAAVKRWPDLHLVVLDKDYSTVPLRRYEHPSDAMYIVGPDSDRVDIPGLMDVAEGRIDVVQISTPLDAPMWSPVALGIALYDSVVKWP